MFLQKYDKSLLLTLLNLGLIFIFNFSSNFLEEDLIIGVFSTSILFTIFFFLKDLVRENARQYRRRIKKAFRVQRDFLTRNYFIMNKIGRLHFVYMKKLIIKNYSIKCLKLYLNVTFKIKYIFSKIIYLKIYYFNIVILSILKLSFKLLNLFYFYI